MKIFRGAGLMRSEKYEKSKKRIGNRHSLALKYCFLVFMFFAHFTFGQEGQDAELTKKYREDQFYLGVSFISFSGGTSDFKQNGLSPHFQIGFVRDMPLTANGRLAAGIGVGYDSRKWVSNWLRVANSDGTFNYTFWESNSSFEKMEYTFQSVVFPLCLRWRNATATDYKFWRMYGGVKLCWNYIAKAVNTSQKIRISDEINPWTSEVYLSFGYNTWNFYVAYQLGNTFKKIPETQGLGNVRTMKIGLIFYVL